MGQCLAHKAKPRLARAPSRTRISARPRQNLDWRRRSQHECCERVDTHEGQHVHCTRSNPPPWARTPGRTRSGARPRQNPDWCRKGQHECCARTPSLSTHTMDSMSMAPQARPRGRSARPRQNLALCVPEAEPQLARARGRASNWRAPKAKPRWLRAQGRLPPQAEPRLARTRSRTSFPLGACPRHNLDWCRPPSMSGANAIIVDTKEGQARGTA